MDETICLTLPFNNLASIIRQETDLGVRQVIGLDKDVCKFINNFRAIELMIEHEEGRHEEGSPAQLRKLKDTFYRVEDVLDAWNTAAGKLQIWKELAKSTFSPTRKVCSIPSYLQRHCSHLVLSLDIAFKTKNLNKTLDVAAKYNKLKIEELKPKMISSFTNELSEAHGRDLSDISTICDIRDNEREDIVNHLLSGQSVEGPTLPVISIVGAGGLGKTTLAQLIFNDGRVNNYFDKRIWVSVSNPLDKIRVSKSILKSLNDDAPNPIELDTVLQQIGQFIDKKKFLLVLDDMHIDEKDLIFWKQLKHSLKHGSRGSKVLITACDMKEDTKKITLKALDDHESCWSLLSQVAFSKGEECRDFEQIGRQLVKKCKGLPIAIKILGGLLCFKKEIGEWQNILNSEIWELGENEDCFPPLLLSYYDLPSTLRKCFSYCAIFPKNYEIEKDQLINLWMSQNYLKAEGQKDMEKIGEEYFKSLVMRSFFIGVQRNECDGNMISYKIHDILYNSFKYLKEIECFSMSQSYTSNEKVRHLMIMFEKDSPFPVQVYNERKLRSLLVEPRGCFVSDIDLSKLFDQLTHLRTLDLSNNDNVLYKSIKEIPEGINKLIHLRYLNLSNNRKIRKLPETLCELYNLQTLELSWCSNLQSLPQRMGKLINLRHIVNNGTSLSYMPKGIERLTRLRTLKEFVVSGGASNKASTFKFLRNLNHLQSLGIKFLRNLEDFVEIKKAGVSNKEILHELYLCFQTDEVDRNPEADHDQKNVIDELAALASLKRLEISYYSGSMLSSSLISSLHNLRVMLMDRCMNFEQLPPLGNLPCLESLSIRSMKRVKTVGNEFLGIEIYGTSFLSSLVLVAFPKLKYLEFQNLKEWNEWNYYIPEEIKGGENISIMPCLGSLKIDNCPKLETLPDYICQKELKSSLPPILKESYIDYRKKRGDLSISNPSFQSIAKRITRFVQVK